MNKDSLLWIVILISMVFLFLFGIPFSLYNSASVIISMIGGLLVGISLYYFLKALKKNKDDFYSPIVAVTISSILITIVFIYNSTQKKTRLLQSEGVITKATIIDGHSMEGRRGGIYNIKVAFLNQKGKRIQVETSIGENSFAKVAKGQEISIIYHPNEPTILTPILTKEDIENYITKGKGIKIEFSVLEKFKGLKSEGITEYLKPYPLWEYVGISDYGEKWTNSTTTESIYINPGQIIYTKENQSDVSKWRTGMRLSGFKMTDTKEIPEMNGDSFSLTKNTTYEKENQKILIRQVFNQNIASTIISYTFE